MGTADSVGGPIASTGLCYFTRHAEGLTPPPAFCLQYGWTSETGEIRNLIDFWYLGKKCLSLLSHSVFLYIKKCLVP